MDLNHVHLAVGDLSRARRFYEDYLGFREKTFHGSCLFLTNDQGFDLALDPDVLPEPLPKWFHLGCRLGSADDVRALHDRIARGTPERIDRPLEEHEGFVFFRVTDPDGTKHEVYWE